MKDKSQISSTKRKYLNAFAGFGGNTELINRDEWEVTHIENDSKRGEYLRRQFPEDIIILTDAYEYIRDYYDKFDYIHLSPPCQSWSILRESHHKNGSRKLPDTKMYSVLIYLKRRCKVPFVMENVKSHYDYLIKPNAIVGRHVIWSNYDIPDRHFKTEKNGVWVGNTKRDKEMRNRMNPEIGLYLFNCRTEVQKLEEWF